MSERLTKAEAKLIAERVEHRLRWASDNAMPHDLPDMVRRLVAHALATVKR